MAAQSPPIPVNNQNLADILVSQGTLSPAIADRIKLAEVQSGKSQEDLIREQNLVDQKALAQAKAVFYNVPYVDLETIPISPDALAVVTQDIASRFHVFPIGIDRAKKELSLAMSDPLDFDLPSASTATATSAIWCASRKCASPTASSASAWSGCAGIRDR